MRTILNERRIGIEIGQVTIGLMAFPWLRFYGNEPKYKASFWKWFFCPPRIDYSGVSFKKYVQLRILCFVIQVTT